MAPIVIWSSTVHMGVGMGDQPVVVHVTNQMIEAMITIPMMTTIVPLKVIPMRQLLAMVMVMVTHREMSKK